MRTRNGATDGIELSAAKGNILVDANTTRGVRDYIVSGGASLMVGMAGSVSVVNYDSAITGEGMDAIGDAIDILNKNLADNDNTMDSGAARSGLFGDANFASNLQFVLDTVSDLDVSTVASLGDYTYVNAKSLSINATDTINNDQHAGGVSAALGISGVAVALGASVAYTGISGDATARIGDFSNITLTDDLNMESKVVINGSTNSYFGALAAGNIAVAVGGAVSVVDADINADTSVGKSVNIDTIGDASIVANSNVHLENMFGDPNPENPCISTKIEGALISQGSTNGAEGGT